MEIFAQKLEGETFSVSFAQGFVEVIWALKISVLNVGFVKIY